MIILIIPIILLVIATVLILIVVLQSGFHRRCPQCHRWWAGQKIHTELVGIFRKDVLRREAYMRPARRYRKMSEMRTHEKYKLHYRCKFCGYEWSSFLVRAQ